jgi:hypothetical protein
LQDGGCHGESIASAETLEVSWQEEVVFQRLT